MLSKTISLLFIVFFYNGCSGSSEMLYDIANDNSYTNCADNPNQYERRECEEKSSHTYQEYKRSKDNEYQ